MLLAILGYSDATVGAVLAVVWTVILTVGLWQYANGDRSCRKTYSLVAMATAWVSYGLLQVSIAFDGIVEIAIVVIAVGTLCVGVVFLVRWWRLRNADSEIANTTT